MNENAPEIVMMEVMVRVTNQMRMNDLWAEMEEWRWKDEMMKAHLEHVELMDQ